MRVFITGASSGIGQALARRFDAMGAELGLVGRSREKLEATLGQMHNAERHAIYALDVTDRAALFADARDFDAKAPVDIVLANAGISIGVTRLFYVLGEQGLLNSDICTAPADVLILPMTEDLSEAISLATDLRAAGVSTQIYTEKKKFKAKMNYADKIGVPYVIFLGDDEIAAGVVACKDMATGEQTKLGFDETLALIRSGLAEKNKGAVILE